jgi:hypothetical protein
MSSYSLISLVHVFLEVITHTSGQDEWLRRMHSDCANVVGMCLERCDLLRGVVVVDAQLEVIGTCMGTCQPLPSANIMRSSPTRHYPILPGDEATGADGDVSELERLDNRLRYV